MKTTYQSQLKKEKDNQKTIDKLNENIKELHKK